MNAPSKVYYILLSVFITFYSYHELVAQQPEALIPHGEEEAALTVSQFLSFFNELEYDSARSLISNDYKAFDYDLGQEQFALQDWIENPVDYFLIHLYGTEQHQIVVENRIISGSFVTQIERWVFQLSNEPIETRNVLTTYKVRNGKIHRIWYFPDSPGRVSPVRYPTFEPGSGPTVWIDLAHNNIDAPETTYFKFVELLRQDGYRVKVWERPFTHDALDSLEILTIVNAVPESHITGASSEPNEIVPSPFTPQEIQAVAEWVNSGGSLLLIADHDPMAGAAKELAAAFGAHFRNGGARVISNNQNGNNYTFRRSNETLVSHPITDGNKASGFVDSVTTFYGQAFTVSDEFEPILRLPESMVFAPAGSYNDSTKWLPADGWVQAAVRDYGEGRVALFGEAWMFRFFDSAELDPNALLVRNLMAWLARKE